MTRKPNFAKFILGTVVLALLFVGTWAATSARLTSAKKIAVLPTSVSNSSNLVSRYAAPLAPAAGDDSIFTVFELDGDIADNPAGAPDDWSTVNCGGGTADAETGVIFDGLGNSIYTGGGSKDPELIASWKWKNGSVPDKDEILNAYAAKYTASGNGDDILIFGADRYSNNGTAFIGIWFFQQTVFAAADGKFRQGPLASDPLSAHEIGDVLVLVEFTGGGSVPTAKVFEWVGTGGGESGGTLNDITGTNDNPNAVFSVSNAVAQTISSCPSWVHTPKVGPLGTIQINDFFEGGINLDAFPALTGRCFSSFLVETRSSASVTSTLKDFVLGQFDTCPNVTITKTADDDNICAGDDTTYTYTVSNPGSALTGTVIDDNETPGDTSDDLDVTANCAPIGGGTAATVPIPNGDTVFQCTRTLSAGTHTNVVTVVAGAGGFSTSATATETVTVNANPDARISVVACADGSTFLTASDANNTPGVTFTWTGAGGASTTGTTRTITGTGSYTVTATSGDCSDSATRVISFCSDSVDAP